MNYKEQVASLERVLKVVESRVEMYDKRSKEELENNNPLQYAGFCFLAAGVLAAVNEIRAEITQIKRQAKRSKK